MREFTVSEPTFNELCKKIGFPNICDFIEVSDGGVGLKFIKDKIKMNKYLLRKDLFLELGKIMGFSSCYDYDEVSINACTFVKEKSFDKEPDFNLMTREEAKKIICCKLCCPNEYSISILNMLEALGLLKLKPEHIEIVDKHSTKKLHMKDYIKYIDNSIPNKSESLSNMIKALKNYIDEF